MEQPLAPDLRIAVLCERVLEEKDGSLSLIRIIDRLVITAEGKNVPRELPPGQIPLTALASWINGLGNYEAKIRVDFPDGDSFETPTLPFYLDSLDKVQNQIVRLVLPVKRPGVYWFSFMLNDETQRRVPMRVIYQRKQLPRPRTKQST